jgi:hypothetical protein
MVLMLSNSISQSRTIRLNDFERAPNVLDDYAHRYVVMAHKSWWRRDGVIPLFCSAVERLEARGWEPVAWNLGGRRSSVVLRRLDAAPETE